jgi:peptide/nickel transport system permease protein
MGAVVASPAINVAARASRGLWQDAARRLLRNRPALLGLGLVALFVAGAVLAPVIAPYDPIQGALADRLQPPSPEHWMGTDLQGRDEFTRILYGAQVSLQVGVVSVMLALIMGGTLGAVAGILRGSLLSLRSADYVVAARSIGAPKARILLRHMLPNALTPLIVAATLALATAIIDVAGLGFLGLGPPDPRTAEWGTMLTDSTKFLRQAPHLLFFPGIMIVLTAIGFNLLGDGLRESLDPRMKR